MESNWPLTPSKGLVDTNVDPGKAGSWTPHVPGHDLETGYEQNHPSVSPAYNPPAGPKPGPVAK